MFDGKRLIVYELNEIPLRVIQWFRSRNPSSAIASLLEHGALVETSSEDDGHLSPWILRTFGIAPPPYMADAIAA